VGHCGNTRLQQHRRHKRNHGFCSPAPNIVSDSRASRGPQISKQHRCRGSLGFLAWAVNIKEPQACRWQGKCFCARHKHEITAGLVCTIGTPKPASAASSEIGSGSSRRRPPRWSIDNGDATTTYSFLEYQHRATDVRSVNTRPFTYDVFNRSNRRQVITAGYSSNAARTVPKSLHVTDDDFDVPGDVFTAAVTESSSMRTDVQPTAVRRPDEIR